MYPVNSIVVHRREGLCVVNATTEINGEPYYVLSAKRGAGESLYIPIAKADQLIRSVMSVENADRVLKYMCTLSDDIIANTKQRRDNFKKRLLNGSTEDIVYLARQLYLYRTLAQMPDNVRFGSLDLELLETAENILFDEFEITYGVDKSKMFDFIRTRINEMRSSL
ncbi:MAG: CarD family transcriptional regulator [Coprobacillus sp.]|nr:CarD family transcriptional regulator [Coprobacillus sp.]